MVAYNPSIWEVETRDHPKPTVPPNYNNLQQTNLSTLAEHLWKSFQPQLFHKYFMYSFIQ